MQQGGLWETIPSMHGIALEAALEQKLHSFLCSPHPADDESFVPFYILLDSAGRAIYGNVSTVVEWCISRSCLVPGLLLFLAATAFAV